MFFATARVAPEKAVFRPALPMCVLPGISEMHMTMTYKEQLLSPNWQRRRLEILQRDEFTCQTCYDSESTLHVHHKTYVKGRKAWEYEGHELITLCKDCHENAHAQSDAFKALVARLPLDGPGDIASGMALLAGWAHGKQGMDFMGMFNEHPFNFAVGEIANLITGLPDIERIFLLLSAMQKAPVWVLVPEIDAFIDRLDAKKDDPIPEGWGATEL